MQSSQWQAPVIGKAIIQLVSDLLLVLIIMEVFGTVLDYLKTGASSLQPFLFIVSSPLHEESLPSAQNFQLGRAAASFRVQFCND